MPVNGLPPQTERDLMATTLSESVHKTEELTPLEVTAQQQQLHALAQQLRQALGQGKELRNLADRARFLAALEESRPRLDAFITICERLRTLVAGGHRAAAQAAWPELSTRFAQLGTSMAQLEDAVTQDAAVLTDAARQAILSAQHTFLLAVALAVSSVLLGLFFIARSITIPLTKMTTTAARIAAGDIDQQLDHYSEDEIGLLATTFRHLIHYIKSMADAADVISKGDLSVHIAPCSEHDVLAKSFLRMIENLRLLNRQVQDGARVLATTISEILASATQLTASVNDTATSVSQTAVTIDEVKQIACLAGQKAKDVSDNAQETVRVSQGGTHAIDTALDGLRRLREQMLTIAESVSKLDQRSQTIRAIIDSVNELAEQSNLLAVNAAIEAAKAGEQGKGFAVVAQEVRVLATRSKDATAQVRAVLKEIQQATHLVVCVTEQGTKAVEASVHQAMDAGASIRTLSQSITDAAHAVTQILASSEQQLMGINQVTTAISGIKAASAQNAMGMRQIKSG